MEISDLGSSGSCFDGDRFKADSVTSESGGKLCLSERGVHGSGEAEGSGVGSEDCEGLGVTDARLLRG